MVNIQDLAGYDYTGARPDDSINADLRLDEIDSLANVEIITRVERRYDIEISDDEAARVETVDDFVRLVSSRVARRG